MSSNDAAIKKLRAEIEKLKNTKQKSIFADPQKAINVYTPIDEAAKKLINVRNDQISWLGGFIEDMTTHENAVNGVKTGAAAVGVLSTVALFTPLAPLGVAGLITGGVAGAATSIGDLIANQVKNGTVDQHVNESKASEEELAKAIEEFQKVINEIVKVTKVDKEMAESIFHAVLGEVKSLASGGVAVSSAFVQMATCGPALANISGLARLGVPVTHAARLAAATSAASAGVAGGRVALDTGRMAAGQAATVAAKSLAVLGAVVSVVDCIMSWVNGNPTKNGAIEVKKQLTENRDDLVQYRKQWQPHVINVKLT